MKICILTTIHSPFDTRLFSKEAKSLSKKNDVDIIAPSDEVINENVDGVNIITIPKIKSKLFHVFTIWRLLNAALRDDYDVFQCDGPGSLFVGVILKIIKRKKIIYDVRDYYPSLIAENDLFPSILKPFIRFISAILERILCMFVDSILVVDEIMYLQYKKYNHNVAIISNYPKFDMFHFEKHSGIIKKEKVIIYIGGLIKDKSIFECIQAIEKSKTNIPNIKIRFIGKFSDNKYKNDVELYIQQHSLRQNVDFLGWIPHEDTIEYLSMADIGIVILQSIPRYIIAVSVKLFEYMASGIPVIASNFPETRKIIEKWNCGILVDPTNIQEISDAILWLLEHPEEAKQMGENGRRAVEETYNWENMEKRLFEVYEELS